MNLMHLWHYFALAGITIFAFNLVWNYLIMFPITYLFAFLKIYRISLIFRVVGFYIRASLLALSLTATCTYRAEKTCFILLLFFSILILIDILWHIIHVWAEKCHSLLDYSFFHEIPESLLFDLYLISFTVLFFIFASFKPVFAISPINILIINNMQYVIDLFFIGIILKIFGALYMVYHLFSFIKRVFCFSSE